jgi:ketosteroid isomerase-like protein
LPELPDIVVYLEALEARLSPFKRSDALDDEESARLRTEAGDGFPERVTAFREEMAVHGRYRAPCPGCGSPVQRIVYAQNAANYCATCQTGGKLLAGARERSFRILREAPMRVIRSLLVAVTLISLPAQADNATKAVYELLDDFHQAASVADGERYFGHFTPDAIFLGTDATERWTVGAFRAYAKPYFSQGRGWTYKPVERHVMLSADGSIAWFDEKLKNEKYGLTRGTGVLQKTDAGWKIAHYSLTFLVPNDASEAVVAAIRADAESKRD